MNNFNENLAKLAFDMTKQEAHVREICISCKQEPTIYTEAGKKEYRISGMCEKCFDELFKEE